MPEPRLPFDEPPQLPDPNSSAALAERIQIFAYVQSVLALCIILLEATFDPSWQFQPTFLLATIAGGASMLIFALRHHRFAEWVIYGDVLLVSSLILLAGPLSGEIDGSAWILLQIWPPLVIFVIQRQIAVLSITLPLLLFLLVVSAQLTGMIAVEFRSPAETLWRQFSYHLLLLVCSSAVFLLLLRGQQRSHQLAMRAESQLRHKLQHVHELIAEKADLNKQLELALHERTRLAEERASALARSEERYALASRSINDGLWDWDRQQRTIFFSSRWKALIGWRDDEISNDPEEWLGRIHPDDRSAVEQTFAHPLKNAHEQLSGEYRLLHRDGSYRWMFCQGLAIADAQGQITRIVGSQTDVTARRLAEERLRHYALHDALTGLPNRFAILDHLDQLLRREEAAAQPFAVLFLDLDRFKTINDSLGHLWGDELLVSVTHRLRDCLGGDELLARMGGDEFAIVTAHAHAEAHALALAERIVEVLRQPFLLYEHEIFIHTSIGIALSALGYELPDAILRDADAAMYVAKIERRGIVVFDSAMHARAMVRLQIEHDLYRAIERDEFHLVYQPIMHLATQQLVGFEALLRWTHPTYGVMSPERFIPIAEDIGLIAPIGHWVLRTAAQQLADWHALLPPSTSLSMSVNVSPRQIVLPALVDQVASLLKTHQLAPRQLRIEIVESGLISEGETASMICGQLRDLGVPISIDDFGTGYSSLSYLYRFPVDTIKIDRSFVSRISRGDEHRKIIAAILSLGQSLGLEVIAEGVESNDQFHELIALGCRYGQGWFFAKALDAEAATQFVRHAFSLTETTLLG